MKVILSRKGFDSKYGGRPSPVLSNGQMVSFPIPSDEDGRRYSDISAGGSEKMSDLMASLGIEPNRRIETCHLDPDLDRAAITREAGWRPSFGQSNGAQTHLSNCGVGVGDLFLFFGWFANTQLTGGSLRYLRGNDNQFHAIFGYMEVREVLSVGPSTKIPKWLEDHPHAGPYRRAESGNTIYVAAEKLSFAPHLAGGGVLRFHESNCLTRKGFSRSRWGLEEKIFRGVRITHHSEASWKTGYFQSAAIGQEFVIEGTPAVVEWAKNRILMAQS